MNWRAAKVAYKEVIGQYESLAELGPTERSRPEFTSFLLDVEKLTQKTLTPAELTLFHRRRKNLAAKERDALEPTVIADLIRDAVLPLVDKKAWGEAEKIEQEQQVLLEKTSDQWDEVVEYLE